MIFFKLTMIGRCAFLALSLACLASGGALDVEDTITTSSSDAHRELQANNTSLGGTSPSNNINSSGSQVGDGVAAVNGALPETNNNGQAGSGPPPGAPAGGTVKPNKPVFGTSNGYESGGTEPLCWESNFDIMDNETLGQNYSNEIEELNEKLFVIGQEAKLLSSCYNGTEFTVQPLDKELLSNKKEMLLGVPYKFDLTLTMDLSAIGDDFRYEDLENITTVHFRLHVCDAVRQGFCNPILDTREKDANLTREESDLDDGTGLEPLPETEEKWKYEEGTTLLGLFDDFGSDEVMYGRWCRWKFRSINGTSTFTTSIEITFQLPQSDNAAAGRRPYFFLGHAVLDLALSDDEVRRIDISQTVSDNVVYVKPQPKVLEATTTVKIVLGVAIGIIALFSLVCLVYTIVHRKNNAIRMAQGPFLSTMAGGCFVACIFSFTFLPTGDAHCKMVGPLVIVPLTLVAAIMVARVWRVYGTLANINSMGKAGSKSRFEICFVNGLNLLAGLPVCSSSSKQARGSFRSVVTAKQTCFLIGSLTFPQAVLQVVASIVVLDGLVTEYSTLGNVGRVVCSDDHAWVSYTGLAYLCFINVIAVFMAWFSRELPSVFNEKDQVFHAAAISTILTGMSIGIAAIIDQPTTSPDAAVILAATVSLGVSFSVTLLLIWPKVSRLMSGEAVVVSSVLGSRYSSKISQQEIQLESAAQPETTTSGVDATANVDHIHLNRNDPIPEHIETKILEVQGLLRRIEKRSGDGRPPSKEDWMQMQDEVGKLKADLDLVEFSDDLYNV